jgi:hypothetical protein
MKKQRSPSAGVIPQKTFSYDLKKVKDQDKVPYLQDLIAKMEAALRERTDDVLRNGPAFDMILESQRNFAVY